jgi:hypothetical protein
MEFIVNENRRVEEEVYKRQGTAIVTQEVPICQHQPVPHYFQPNGLRTRGEIGYICTDTEATQK